MGLLEEILVKVQKLPLDQQVKQFCDKILEEEKGKDEHFIVAPKGPNIFLNLQVPAPTPDDVAFLCLERQFEGKYIVSLRTLKISKIRDQDVFPRKVKVWEVKSDKAEGILNTYAEKYKFLKGE